MVGKSTVRRGVHAVRLASDGNAFQIWEEFMKICRDEDEVIANEKKGFGEWKAMAKEERLPSLPQVDKQKSDHGKLLHKEENEMRSVSGEQWITVEAL